MKQKYEISVWEDVLSEDGNAFEERKIIVIGSDTMTSESRAREPKLVTNINGTNKFTFNMYYTYIDTRTGEKVENPYIKYLINERKIKVFWKNEWYDLLIKQIKEDQVQHVFSYTCEDAYITELSRTGFELTFATELENNIGTAQELVEKVIENTDWQFDETGSDKIYQETEEPVYETTIINEISIVPDLGTEEIQLIPGMPALVYYSCAPDIENLKTPVQFYYSGTTQWEQDENDMLVINGNCFTLDVKWIINDTTAIATYNGAEIFSFKPGAELSTRYRAKRCVQSQKTIYNSILDRYVNVYNDGELLGYNTTEFNDALAVVNLFTNSSNFQNTSGWKGDGLIFKLSPEFGPDTEISAYKAISYLRLPTKNNQPQYIYNTGIQNNRSYIPDGFIVGENYILRLKIKEYGNNPAECAYITNPSLIRPSIQSRDIDYNPTGTLYFQITNSFTTEDDWLEYDMTCIKSCPYDKILSSLEPFGLFLQAYENYWLEEAQFFREIYGEDGAGNLVRINPNQLSCQSVAQVYWKYFASKQPEGTTKDTLVYEHVSLNEWDEARPVYNNFERYSTIEADNSNRFNILQSIAEAFECWIRFKIEHDDKGYIILDNGVPRKYIQLKRETGKETGIGFIYGIDLKGVVRNIKSDKISTKTIVEQNENEFGKNGFCSIARSEQNYPRESFILNFDYYIQQGLMNRDTLYNDLYNVTGIGYYPQLHTLNIEYAENLDLLINKKLELTRQSATATVYNQYIVSTEDEIASVDDSIIKLAGVQTLKEAENYAHSHLNDTKVQSLLNDRAQLTNILNVYKNSSREIQSSINNLNEFISTTENRQNEIIELLTALNKQFFVKYSRFIQEGTWTSEDYWNDDLYYLDAVQVAYTSSRPQVSYEINVLRLSDIADYSSKVFNLGGISFVQDVEYFGYKEDKITPYKEKVILTEITSYFDTPDKDLIKVQNYKTQFDDLFQRITAAVQNLELTQGKYAKAANIVATDGTIRSSVIQNTFNENKDLVYGAQNESATIDNTGITVTDNANAAKQVKVTSGGVFVTADGGTTWKNAIRGDGISTDLLTAGRINTEQITVYNGEHPSFRWDPNGLNAYDFTNGAVNTKTFVRFDQYGVYGITNGPEVYTPTSEDQVYQDANFGLTWSKFFMKSKDGDRSIEISTDKDIVVKDGNINRVIIGRVDPNNLSNYGIRVRNEENKIIFQCDNNGSYLSGWLLEEDCLSSSNIGQAIKIYADGNIGCYGHEAISSIEDAFEATLKQNMPAFDLKQNKNVTLPSGTTVYIFVKEVNLVSTYQKYENNQTGSFWNNDLGTIAALPSSIEVAATVNGKIGWYQLNNLIWTTVLGPWASDKVKNITTVDDTKYLFNYTGIFNCTAFYNGNTLFEIKFSTNPNEKLSNSSAVISVYNTKKSSAQYYIPAADTKWSIDKNGQAVFHDIYADSGTIAGWFINSDKIYQTYDGTTSLTRRINGQDVSNIKQQLSTVGSTTSVNDYSFITDAINAAIAQIGGMTFKNGMIDGYVLSSIYDLAQEAYNLAASLQSSINDLSDKMLFHHHKYWRTTGVLVSQFGLATNFDYNTDELTTTYTM